MQSTISTPQSRISNLEQEKLNNQAILTETLNRLDALYVKSAPESLLQLKTDLMTHALNHFQANEVEIENQIFFNQHAN